MNDDDGPADEHHAPLRPPAPDGRPEPHGDAPDGPDVPFSTAGLIGAL